MKKVLIYGVAAAFFCVAGLSGICMADVDKGPADIVLGEGGKKPVIFLHAGHQAREGSTCGDCHHSKDADGKKTDYTDGMAIAKCDTCHNAEAAAANAEASADEVKMKKHVLYSFKNAAHANCKGCHKGFEDKELGKKLSKCTACHPKKKK